MKYAAKLNLPSTPINTSYVLDGETISGIFKSGFVNANFHDMQLTSNQINGIRSIMPDAIKPHIISITLMGIRETYPHRHKIEKCVINFYIEVNGEETEVFEGENVLDNRWLNTDNLNYEMLNIDKLTKIESYVAKEGEAWLLDTIQPHSVANKDSSLVGHERYAPFDGEFRLILQVRLSLPYENALIHFSEAGMA